MGIDPHFAFVCLAAGAGIGLLVVLNLWSRWDRAQMTEAQRREHDATAEEDRRTW